MFEVVLSKLRDTGAGESAEEAGGVEEGDEVWGGEVGED